MSAFGTKRTSPSNSAMSAFGGKADIELSSDPDPIPIVRCGVQRARATRSWRVLINSATCRSRTDSVKSVEGPPMQQILDWLEKLGLGQYAQRFAENDIDFEILNDLTDQDLEKIGVTSLGHRRKLLRAITTATSAAAVAAAPPATPRAVDSAERRQVTVMFSDLVGWTALSARMDPEDLREIISAYHKCVAEAVHRFGGFVAQYLGDGVLVYFGYPEAHEDDAERAVRAGLELIAAVIALKTPAALQTRVGIATGLVVVGD